MRQINALQIQEDLRNMKYVTIPQLQLTYGMSYGEAKEFVEQLQKRGWVSSETKDIRYTVYPKRLCLRRIRRDEVDGLYEDLTNDCILALTQMQKLEGEGAAFRDLERAVHGDDDTNAAIRILLKHKLIYQCEELYFLTVSRKTVDVLWSVDMEKRKTALRRKMSDSTDHDREIKKLFDVLFED